MNKPNILAVIPARGGSKRIPRKNVRFLNGKPLIYYSINNALQSKYITDVVVSTDDDEVAYYAEQFGATVWKRPKELAKDDTTLDSVIFDATIAMEKKLEKKFNYVVTLQPTSPNLSSHTIDRGIHTAIDGKYDCVMSMVDSTHLYWGEDKKTKKVAPLYEERVNSQYLPRTYQETGGVVISKRSVVTKTDRLGKKVHPLILETCESIDIDNYYDWWFAERQMKRKKILIYVNGSREIGLGHIYRCILLANSMIDHEVLFCSDSDYSLGIDKLAQSLHPVKTIHNESDLLHLIDTYKPNMIINDVLNTSEAFIKKLRKKDLFVINFEDVGPGTKHAHLIINSLYEPARKKKNFFSGSKYYCLRDELQLYPRKKKAEKAKSILLTFGGTDPANLTHKVLTYIKDLANDYQITVIAGLGYAKYEELKEEFKFYPIHFHQDIYNMGSYIHKADLVITSAGNTVYESISLATPTLSIAQNDREMTHPIVHEKNGIVFLGKHDSVTDAKFMAALKKLTENVTFREETIKKMLKIDLRNGIRNVKNLIYNTYEEYLAEHHQ